jgi:hypothetical protein
VLLACAVFLAIGQLLVGPPTQLLPDLPLIGVTALLPMVLAMRITQVPGAASAVCVAYSLPRSLIALFQSRLDQPPLLLVAAIVFDLGLWLLNDYAPPLQPKARAALAGAIFGAVLAAIEPTFRMFLGANPLTWTGPDVWVAVVATAAACAAIAPVLSVRGRAS